MRDSANKVGVADDGACNGKYVTKQPFPQLSNKAAEADTFKEFSISLISVGKTANDGNVLMFTKEVVTVYKEEDVLITYQRKNILVCKQDEHGLYQILLTQACGQWQPHKPTKKSKNYIQQDNSVYNLQSTEEAIKWMYAVCGYPVNSTCIKAIKAGNYIGWPIITERNVARY